MSSSFDIAHLGVHRQHHPQGGSSMPKRTYKTFRELVKALREHHGWSQTTLAAKLGITQPTISSWESGRQVAGEGSCVQLASVLGISQEEIMRTIRRQTRGKKSSHGTFALLDTNLCLVALDEIRDTLEYYGERAHIWAIAPEYVFTAHDPNVAKWWASMLSAGHSFKFIWVLDVAPLDDILPVAARILSRLPLNEKPTNGQIIHFPVSIATAEKGSLAWDVAKGYYATNSLLWDRFSQEFTAPNVFLEHTRMPSSHGCSSQLLTCTHQIVMCTAESTVGIITANRAFSRTSTALSDLSPTAVVFMRGRSSSVYQIRSAQEAREEREFFTAFESSWYQVYQDSQR